MSVFGLIPASGKASRLGGLPKFSLPCDLENTSLLERHIDLLAPFCDKIIVSTTSKWENLVRMIDLDIEVMVIEPSTMNDALLQMQAKFPSESYLIGMADTYFLGDNPYEQLFTTANKYDLGLALWNLDSDLKGKVGQVLLKDKGVIDVQDKKLGCDYNLMWGALSLNAATFQKLNSSSANPLNDLNKFLTKNEISNSAHVINGRYFDLGTLTGYSELLRVLKI